MYNIHIKPIYSPIRTDHLIHLFDNTAILRDINGFILKKFIDNNQNLHYGILNHNGDLLIAYLELNPINNGMVSSTKPIILREFTGQGWLQYLIDYAILIDKHIIRCDNTTVRKSKDVWIAVINQCRCNTYLYNTLTNIKVPYREIDEVLFISGNTHLYLELYPYSEEQLNIQKQECRDIAVKLQRFNGMYNLTLDYFYGPGTSNYGFWNP